MVSNYKLNNKHYKLIRVGENFNGMGVLAASRNPQFFRTSHSAYDDLTPRGARVSGGLRAGEGHHACRVGVQSPTPNRMKDAHGLMQVLPSTAQRYGVGTRVDIYDPLPQHPGRCGRLPGSLFPPSFAIFVT